MLDPNQREPEPQPEPQQPTSSHVNKKTKTKNKVKLKNKSQMYKEKSGTKGSQEKNLALINSDDADRAAMLYMLLSTGVGNNSAFQMVSLWLMGGSPADLDTAYKAHTLQELEREVSLDTDLAACFKGYKLDYLRGVIANEGQPKLDGQIRMALGLVTGSNPNKKEVVRIIEADVGKAAAVWDDVKADVKKQMTGVRGEAAYRRVLAAIGVGVQSNAMKEAREDENQEDPGEEDEAALIRLKSIQLRSILKQYTRDFKHGVDRQGLAAELVAWSKKETEEVRTGVCTDGSPFRILLDDYRDKTISKVSNATHTYFLGIVEGRHEIQPLKSLGLDEVGIEEEERQKRQKEADEDVALVSEVRGYMDRKQSRNKKLRHQHWATLKEKIEGMTDEQRELFVVSYMSKYIRMGYEAEDSTAEQKRGYYRTGVGNVRTQLQSAGMKGETLEKTMSRFSYGASEGTTHKRSTYWRLKRLVARTRKSNGFAKQALTTIADLSSSELLQVVHDRALLAKLKTRAKKRWADIRLLLSINDDLELVGVTGEQRGQLRGETMGETQAVSLVADTIQHRPGYWAKLLDIELDKTRAKTNRGWDRNRVMSLVNKAYYAARRKASKQIKAGTNEGASLFVLVRQFMEDIKGGLSGKSLKLLGKRDKLKPALQALSDGRAVTVAERLEVAKFKKGSPKTWRGSGVKAAAVIAAIEECHGAELLNQWTNYPQLEPLYEERKGLAETEDRDEGQDNRLNELNQDLEHAVLDISDDKLELLEEVLPRTKRVEALKTLRKNIATAMKDDAVFQSGMDQGGMKHDPYAQERTQSMGELDEQRLEDSGKQWNTVLGVKGSSKSTLRKESRNQYVGKLRTGKKKVDVEEDLEQRQQVREQQAKSIELSREDLAKRTEAFKQMRAGAEQWAELIVGTMLVIATSLATGGLGAPVWAAGLISLGANSSKALFIKMMKGDRAGMQSLMIDVLVNTGLYTTRGGLGDVVGDLAKLAGATKSNPSMAQKLGKHMFSNSLKYGVTTVMNTGVQHLMDAERDKSLGKRFQGDFLSYAKSMMIQMGRGPLFEHMMNEAKVERAPGGDLEDTRSSNVKTQESGLGMVGYVTGLTAQKTVVDPLVKKTPLEKFANRSKQPLGKDLKHKEEQ